jgi:hypothetical protein
VKNNLFGALSFVFSAVALVVSLVTANRVFLQPPQVETMPVRSVVTEGDSTAPDSVPTGARESISSRRTRTTGELVTALPLTRKAYGRLAEVTLLRVNRIKDPESGTNDLVNVQVRVKRLGDKLLGNEFINFHGVTARNVDTSETYEAARLTSGASEPVSLPLLKRGASGDAYVWLRVPADVSNLNIYIPQTEEFANVRIEDNV